MDNPLTAKTKFAVAIQILRKLIHSFVGSSDGTTNPKPINFLPNNDLLLFVFT